MIEKVCFISFYNQYESKRHFTHQLAKALNNLKIEILIIDPIHGQLTKDHVDEIIKFNPTFTFSFNSSSANETGHYLWDYLQIPHLYALVDPAFYALEMITSPWIFFSSVDRDDCQFFKRNEFNKIFFLPHAVENLKEETQESIYDVAFLGTFIDFESIKQKWEKKLSVDLQEILHKAIEKVFSPNSISLLEALISSYQDLNKTINEEEIKILFPYLDNYTRGKDRFELIRAIKNTQVHVFGEPSWHNQNNQSWEIYAKELPHVILHPAVSYEEGFNILSKSKICLNSTPFFSYGSHERIFNGLMAEALPITTDNGFIKEYFSRGHELETYSLGRWAEVNDTVQSLLHNDGLRREMAYAGKEKVLKNHTWDNRAKELITNTELMLEQFF